MKRVSASSARLLLISSERGETLVGLLASLLIASICLTAGVSSMVAFSRSSIDHKQISEAQDRARIIADTMGFELRMAGSGMPISQSGFLMTDATLNSTNLPVLISSTATSISFRLNEKGVSNYLTAAFNPAGGNILTLFDATGFSAGDTIYLNNMTEGGTGGLRGTISSKAGNTLTLAAGSNYTVGATFPSGSTVDTVSTITYASPSGQTGITRTIAGGSAVVLTPNSTFTLQYLNSAGTPLALPLTAAVEASSLYSIQVTVSVRSEHLLRSGGYYTAQLQNRYALRNLIITH